MYIVGLSVLLMVAVASFFGFYKRFFRREKISPLVIFLFVILFTLGAVLPMVVATEVFSFNIGGFIIPIIFSIVLLIVTSARKEFMRFVLSFFSVATITVLVRTTITMPTLGFSILSVTLAALLCSVAAFLITNSSSVALASMPLGLAVGDTISQVILFVFSDRPISLGDRGIFDILVIALVLSCILIETRKFLQKRKETKAIDIRLASFETALDNVVPVEDEYSKHF